MLSELPKKIFEDFEEEAKLRKLTKSQYNEALDKLREAYNKSKITPGEAIGMITAESFGEPGTQMSISPNEKIIIKIKNRIKICEIGIFVNELIKKYGCLTVGCSEILPLNDLDIYVPSLDKTEKIRWKRVLECSRHKADKKLLKLFTKSGRSIVATDNHSFVIRKNNEIIPVAGRDLTLGDRIPVLKHLLENCVEEINLKDHMTIAENSIFALIEENGLLVRKKTIAKPIPSKLKLDWFFGWFIGAYLAEGNATHGQISISNTDDIFINNVKNFATKIGLDYVEEYHQRGFSFSRDLKINSALLANFIRTTCKTGSSNKLVPEFSFSAKEDFVSGLLRGYFDGDGNFHVSRRMIRVSTNSDELCKGISLLLTRFGIFSHKIKDRKGQYWLLIPYKYAPLFLEKIGSDIEYKRKDLETLAEDAKKFWTNMSQDYTDMIPNFGGILYNIAKKLNCRTRYINNFTKRQKIGRTTLFRYIVLFEKLSKEKNIDIKEELICLKQMFYSDVVWDEIVDMQHVTDEGYVYDLSVSGLETFTTFDGIITHNTLNIFHFAGVAEVNVTLGLPRLIEILDARKDLKTPAMEIYLKKEYSKDPKKVKKIAASIKEIKFKELVSEFSINLPKLEIEALLNTKRMREVGVSEKMIIQELSSSKNVSVRHRRDKIIVKPPETVLRDLFKFKEKIKNACIKGIPGIVQVMPVKSKNEFIILTAGSNLKKVFEVKEVDHARTVTNNIFEVVSVLGIEAGRQAIINEATAVIRDQGLDVDVRHIMLIADMMTSSGIIKGVTRSGITGSKSSVLAKASFETPITHIINASFTGERDYLNSVIENVLVNQPVPVGTGLPDLVIRMKQSKGK